MRVATCEKQSGPSSKGGGGHGAHAGLSASKQGMGRSQFGENRERGVGRGGWGRGGHESGVRSAWDLPGATQGCVVSPRCVEEKLSLLKVSGQAHTTGGVLFVVALKVLQA